MKRTITLTLLALACLTAIPSIAQARYRDGMNLYEYVRSEPVGHGDQIHVSAAGLLGLLGRDRGKPARGGSRMTDLKRAKRELWMPNSGSINYHGGRKMTLDSRFGQVVNMNHKGLNIEMNNDGNMWKMK